MTILRGVSTIVGCVVLGCVLGGALGWCIGKLSPDFIHAVLQTLSDDAATDRVGLSLGLINGTWAGVAVGIAVVAAVAWYETRMPKSS